MCKDLTFFGISASSPNLLISGDRMPAIPEVASRHSI